MQKNSFRRAVFLAAVAGIAFWAWRGSQDTSQPGAVLDGPQAGQSGGIGDVAKTVDSTVPPPSPSPVPPAAAGPVSPEPVPEEAEAGPERRPALVIAPGMPASQEPLYRVIQDIGYMQALLGDFRSALGGNPVGSNAEIIRALLGRNPKKLTLALREDQKLNANGELVDPWGTPYFFHQLSAQVMEIRCAGPDGKLWNKDDISPQ